MRRARAALGSVLLLVSLAPLSAAAFELPGEISGYVAAESRVFFYDAALLGQHRESGIADAVLEPEWSNSWNDDADTVTVRPFFRGDSNDTHRTHFDVRQADYLHVGDGWEGRIGIGKVFWGVTESEHLVDIVNQTDAVEDVDREDKLGQPMLQLTVPRSVGTFDLFVLPGFRTRTFPGVGGRVRSYFAVDRSDPRFVSSMGQARIDIAGRWSLTHGDWQIALSQFYGTGRDPRFQTKLPRELPATVSGLLEETRLRAVYDIIEQTGLELQHTGDAMLWKLEAIGRAGQGSYRFAAAGGFEYTFYALLGSADLGVLGELLYDTFQPDNLPTAGDIPPGATVDQVAAAISPLEIDAAPNPFEQDVFFGFRLALNDTQSTQVLAGGTVDVSDRSRFWSVEASRRLGERFRIGLDLRIFDGFESGSFYHSVVRDDFIQIQLACYI